MNCECNPDGNFYYCELHDAYGYLRIKMNSNSYMLLKEPPMLGLAREIIGYTYEGEPVYKNTK